MTSKQKRAGKIMTWECFKDNFYYDETSPSGLRYKKKTLKRKQDDPAGYIGKTPNSSYKGLWRVHSPYFNRIVLVHHIVWLYHNQQDIFDSRVDVIDHKDGNGLNNNIQNLIKTTMEVNSRNRRKRRDNNSGKTGVFLRTRKKPNGKVYSSWVVSHYPKSGAESVKYFSFIKYGGCVGAFEAACDYRDRVFIELQESGYGYTERHGE